MVYSFFSYSFRITMVTFIFVILVFGTVFVFEKINYLICKALHNKKKSLINLFNSNFLSLNKQIFYNQFAIFIEIRITQISYFKCEDQNTAS